MNANDTQSAIDLILIAEQSINRRRYYEQLCGYGPEYGGDKLLLEKLQEFLELPSIKPEAEILRRAYSE